MATVYHLELRSFPHVARAFNLDRATLDARFVKPWAEGEMIEYEQRRWAPDSTRLTVLAAEKPLRSGFGLGRGWGEATRRGRDVTETVIAEIRRGAEARPEVRALADAVAEVGGERALRFGEVMALAAAAHPGWRASEQLSLAEQAVWEMLHRGRLEMADDDGPVAPERWQEIVLSWSMWTGEGDGGVRLRAVVPPEAAPAA